MPLPRTTWFIFLPRASSALAHSASIHASDATAPDPDFALIILSFFAFGPDTEMPEPPDAPPHALAPLRHLPRPLCVLMMSPMSASVFLLRRHARAAPVPSRAQHHLAFVSQELRQFLHAVLAEAQLQLLGLLLHLRHVDVRLQFTTAAPSPASPYYHFARSLQGLLQHALLTKP